MTDKEKIVILLKGAEIEFEDWNKRLITLDDGLVEIHFDLNGNLTEIIGKET
tara:strand:- start:14378 stop:14533 length:156 start_codon:yes stop_codon:yes gene_type:complete